MKDLLLIEALGRRDKVAFDYIFNYYYSSLCAFAMQYIDDRNAVEDLVQDFFVYLWVEAPQIKIKTSLKVLRKELAEFLPFWLLIWLLR